MGLGHEGLALLARKAKVNLDEMGGTDMLMFMNRAGDKMKVLGANGQVVNYLKMKRGQVIMKEALQFIPHAFGVTGGFNYDQACKIALTKKLGIEGSL